MPSRQKRSSDDDEGDDSGHQQPVGIHLDESLIQRSTLIAEADTLSRQGNYAQAIPLYSSAIKMKSNEALLLCRARCRIFTGDILGALNDSDSALKLNENSLKATLCKADVLFTKGDFEMALVWYHRGLHQKPEHEDFKSGEWFQGQA